MSFTFTLVHRICMYIYIYIYICIYIYIIYIYQYICSKNLLVQYYASFSVLSPILYWKGSILLIDRWGLKNGLKSGRCLINNEGCLSFWGSYCKWVSFFPTRHFFWKTSIEMESWNYSHTLCMIYLMCFCGKQYLKGQNPKVEILKPIVEQMVTVK